jgi:hypothetical protein
MRVGAALLFTSLVSCAATADGLRVGDHQADTEAVLAGMTAGTPVPCISRRDLEDTSIGRDGRALLFQTRRNVTYVTRTHGQCAGSSNDHLRTRSTGTRICTGDEVEIVGSDDIVRGACTIGEFTPYSRAG